MQTLPIRGMGYMAAHAEHLHARHAPRAADGERLHARLHLGIVTGWVNPRVSGRVIAGSGSG